MVLLNAASYGVYLVVVKPLMAKQAPHGDFVGVPVWGLMALPVGLPQALAIDWASFDGGDWSAVAFVVLCTTFLVYLLNIYALGRVQPTVVSIYIYLQPLLVGTMVWLLRAWAGRITWRTWGGFRRGAAVIATGVWLVSVPPRRRAAA